jgi:hypothetical protein
MKLYGEQMTTPTGFEKADRYAEALEKLQTDVEYRTWFTAPEVAVRAATLDESYMARRRFMNKVLGRFGIERGDAPEKPPAHRYGRAETIASLKLLESAGLVESQPTYEFHFFNMEDSLSRQRDRRVVYRLAENEQESEQRPMFRPARVLHDPFELTRHMRNPSDPKLG